MALSQIFSILKVFLCQLLFINQDENIFFYEIAILTILSVHMYMQHISVFNSTCYINISYFLPQLLLEFQFTCHQKFKNAVNAISCKELRLDPIGRDKNGCVYWLQVDHEANLCLYKEDQDEETWQLVAR